MGRRIGFGLLAAMLLAGHPLRAQWVVSDPSNLAQGIVNSTRQVVEASRNGSTLLQSFQQTVKIYEQSKKYYDALRSVHNLVKSARRVQQTMLLVGDISDIYISNFRSMFDDTNYSAEELTAMAAGYTKLLSASADLLNDLKQIITPSGLSMTDKERWILSTGSITRCSNTAILRNIIHARISPCRSCAAVSAGIRSVCGPCTAAITTDIGNL